MALRLSSVGNGIAVSILPAIGFLIPYLTGVGLGPFYLINRADPAYAYLTNSLLLTCGKSPYHIDHPGTPVQILGALVIWFEQLFQLHSPVCPINEVLAHSERYLSDMMVTLQVTVALAAIWFGWRLYRETGNVFAALTAQVLLVMSSRFKTAIFTVHPEPLIIVAVLIFVGAVLPFILQRRPECATDASVAGCILGFGIATKLTVVPMLLFVFLFRSSRSALIFLISAVAGFFIWTLPIIQAYPRIKDWIVDIATHAGHYGSGKVGLPPADYMLANATAILETNITTFVVMLVCAILAVALYFQGRAATPIFRFLSISIAVVIVQTAITAKHPAEQYMLPSVILLAAAAGIVFAILTQENKLHSAAALVIITLAGSSFLAANLSFFTTEQPQWAAADQLGLEKVRAVAAGRCRGPYPYGNVSTVESALLMANRYSRGRFSPELGRLYPGAVEYSGTGTFLTFSSYGLERYVNVSSPESCIFSTRPPREADPPNLDLVKSEGNYWLYRFKAAP